MCYGFHNKNFNLHRRLVMKRLFLSLAAISMMGINVIAEDAPPQLPTVSESTQTATLNVVKVDIKANKWRMLGLPAVRNNMDVALFFPPQAVGSSLFKYDNGWQSVKLEKGQDGKIFASKDMSINPGDAVWIKAPNDFSMRWTIGSTIEGGDKPPKLPDTTEGIDKSADGNLLIAGKQCPTEVVTPGYEFGDGMTFVLRNSFNQPKTGVRFQLYLTTSMDMSDNSVRAPSAHYHNNVLLEGGNEIIYMDRNSSVSLILNGINKIPDDTPPGDYYIGALLDAGNRVSEINEFDNFAFCSIRVVGEDEPTDEPTATEDLFVPRLQCPVDPIQPGDEIGDLVKVSVGSSFNTDQNDVVVDLFLAENMDFSDYSFRIYSENYSDNVLLQGGRENVNIPANSEINVTITEPLKIPDDTPSGYYYIGVLVDAGNHISEADEPNNIRYCTIAVDAVESSSSSVSSESGSEGDVCSAPITNGGEVHLNFTAGTYNEVNLADFFSAESDCPIYNYGIFFDDIDGDGSIGSNDWINGVSLDNNTGLYSGTPPIDDAGKTVAFEATANNGYGTASIMFYITVVN
jgi:hypothetical protein